MSGTIQKFDYHVWASKRVIEHLKSIPEEAFSRAIVSVFPSLKEALFHIYSVDRIWFNRILGQAEGDVDSTFTDLQDAEAQFAALYERMAAYIKEQPETKEVHYRNSKGQPFQNTLLEVIDHLANHGTYHRGNITAMLRQMGFKGTSTDYIFFLRETSNLPI